MTMTATGPYQSKLFNFLNRQSIHWGNRLIQTARRLKITAEWGTQIALYPLYMLVQSSRVAVRQIAAAQVERKRLALAESTAQNPDHDTTEPSLQGLACDLVTQDILFVDQTNQINQRTQSQAELKRRISFRLGSINYEKKQQELISQTPTPQLLPPVQVQEQNRHLLPPVRWFLRGLSWLEQSPVAIAIDLFGESRWHTAVVPPEIYAPQLLPPLPLEPVLKPLDQRLATLEQQLLTPAETPETLPPLQRFFQKIFKFQNITTAITSTETPATQPAPWLTWNDLFRETETTPVQPPTVPTPQPPLVQSLLQDLATPSAIEKSTTTPGAIATTTTQTQALTQHQAKPTATEIEAKPEWIETEALSIGYEQHFLERLLKALDHVLAWVENVASQLFTTLKRLKK